MATERNATFEADRRPVTRADLARAERWLAYARADLLEVADRVAAHERAHGPLPAEGDRAERASAEVLRHLAGAEVWLTSRVDGSLRFDGPPREATLGPTSMPRAHGWSSSRRSSSHATRAWHGPTARARPGRSRRSFGGSSTTRWITSGKLERRLARTDGTAERLVVTLERRPTVEDLTRLLLAVGWDPRVAHPDRLEVSTSGSTEVVTVWDGDQLVGHARSLSDGAMSAYISMVIVHPRYQALGVGRRLMERLLDRHDGVRFALSAAMGMGDWYARLGFEPDERAMVLIARRGQDMPRR